MKASKQAEICLSVLGELRQTEKGGYEAPGRELNDDEKMTRTMVHAALQRILVERPDFKDDDEEWESATTDVPAAPEPKRGEE